VIASTGQSLYATAQASGVAAPAIQRFPGGQRGIVLETVGKLAAYLGLALLPESRQWPTSSGPSLPAEGSQG